MADDDHDPPPPMPPARPGESPQAYARRIVTAAYGVPIPQAPVVLTPESKISLTVWKVGSVLTGVFLAGWLGNHAVQEIKDSIRRLDERLETLTSEVKAADPARLRDDTRRQVTQLLRGLTIECPRPVRKGESVGVCKVVLPLSLREEAP